MTLASSDRSSDSEELEHLLEGQERRPKVTPLPKVQLAAICAIKLLLPIAGTQMLPYVNEMMEGLVLPGDKRSIGYYSGLLLSFPHVTQLLAVYPWARLSDWVGRVPVILLGTAGLSVVSLTFGLSRTFLMALIIRSFGGFFGGMLGAIHSVVGELTDSTNQSTAFPIYDVVAAFAFVLGPIIGATFANPAKQYPDWFDTAFFREYPYFLPCFVTSIIGLFASALAAFLLEETHPHKRRARTVPGSPPDTTVIDDSSATLATPPSVRAILSVPIIRAICATSGALGLIAAGFNTVFVLVCYTPIQDGGLSLSTQQTGLALSIMGLVSIGMKLSLPIVLRHFDTLKVYRLCMQSWPFTFAALPVLNILARNADPASTEAKVFLWIAISIVLAMSRIGCLAFSLILIIVKEHSPSSLALGTTNGISEFVQMIGIAIAPATISALFAFSVSHGLLGGHLWALVSVTVSTSGGILAHRIIVLRDSGSV